MIELLPDFPATVVAAACRGHVSSDDYEKVLIPRVEQALAAHQKVRLYYEIGDDFEAIDPAAVWRDFKVGMEHITRWERIAVVTDVAWIGHTMQAFSFLMPGEVRVFPLAEAAVARDWVVAA